MNNDQRTRRTEFSDYLKENARVVSEWPAWMRQGAWTSPVEAPRLTASRPTRESVSDSSTGAKKTRRTSV